MSALLVLKYNLPLLPGFSSPYSARGTRAAAHLLQGLPIRRDLADSSPGCAHRRHPHRTRGTLPCKCPKFFFF